MPRSRSVTLAGSNLLFIAVSAALLLTRGFDAVIYPAYMLVFMWGDLRREEESHVIFLFLTVVAAALLAARTPNPALHAALAIEAAAIWLLSFGLGAHRNRLFREKHRVQAEVEALDHKIRDDERDLRFYNTYEQSAVSQIVLRRDLITAAKTLSSTMDPEEAQTRLVRSLEGRYAGSRVALVPGTPKDPVFEWSVKTRSPVMIKDARRDERFPVEGEPPCRSVLVVPLHVMHGQFGFVRLESDQVAAYDAEDMRTVDLFATLASLTLENIQLYGEVHNLAIHDSLTQLYTQRAFRQRLKEELLRAGRGQAPLSLIMGDVDFFKRYNDTHGHQAGDELLRGVARLLLAHTRPVDCVARYGGEEFALILPNVARPQAVELAERIRQATSSVPFPFQGQRTQVTMSFGVASFPNDATSQSQLIRVADERLYLSKTNGRDRVS